MENMSKQMESRHAIALLVAKRTLSLVYGKPEITRHKLWKSMLVKLT